MKVSDNNKIPLENTKEKSSSQVKDDPKKSRSSEKGKENIKADT